MPWELSGISNFILHMGVWWEGVCLICVCEERKGEKEKLSEHGKMSEGGGSFWSG